jgi:hypothetical protein
MAHLPPFENHLRDRHTHRGWSQHRRALGELPGYGSVETGDLQQVS